MLDIKNLKGKKAEELLKTYEGKNPYIRFMRKKYELESSYYLTTGQSKYVLDFHKTEPQKMDKVIEITDYYAETLKEEHKLKKLPKKIMVDTLLGETDKAYHVLCKLYRNQKGVKLLWVPKTQLLDDLMYVDIEVNIDFDKYSKMDDRGWSAFNHQKEGIKFLVKNNGCILADDMGLGKTYQSIVAALECGAERVLIVCPSSLKINWMREIENFTDDVAIIKGKEWVNARFVIINYDILKNFHTIIDPKKDYQDWEILSDIVDFNPDLMILDEAHFIKNHKSIRGKILKDIGNNYPTEKVWLLTGTPIANRPMDYYNLLSIIGSPVANNWVHFAKRYCEGRRFKKGGRYIWITDGYSNLEELATKTKRTILRRKKEEVLDLPPKLITPVYLELENRQGYEAVWDEYLAKRKAEGRKGNPQKDLVEMTLLRKFIAMETIPHSITVTEEALKNNRKVIIFCNFSDEIDEFLDHFGNKSVCVRGGMSSEKKQQAVDKFQEDDSCTVFVGQIKAAGVGLTLTKAEVVIMNSLDWVPGNHEQAEDRAYRIGQTRMVNIYYMLMDNTIDNMVWKILNNKKKVIGTIMGENEIIEEFLKQIER